MALAPNGPLTIVKLGGSVITRKREVERLRPKVLARLAREIAEAADAPRIVLHGAGSFGHPGAARFGLARAPEGTVPPRQRLRGAAIVSAEVRRLHLAVLRSMVHAGDVPWSVPAANVARNREGQLASFDEGAFSSALATGATPVSFGDVVPDDGWGYSILSADTIALELARRLRAVRVIFVSDVDGVLTTGSDGRRHVLEGLTEASVTTLRATTSAPDVTGGIRKKAETMLRIAEQGADAGLISGLRDGALSRALRGEAVHGSWCRPAAR